MQISIIHQPIDHEMDRKVFGSVFSPSCSNYALKVAANDNEVKHGPEASYT